jgi:vacuolar-type H+-ATPase catalytic subunit A/Vma1
MTDQPPDLNLSPLDQIRQTEADVLRKTAAARKTAEEILENFRLQSEALTRILREDFLQQSSYHEIDRYCPLTKSYWMLKAIIDLYHLTQAAMQAGKHLEDIISLPVVGEIAWMKELPPAEADEAIKALMNRVHLSFAEWGVDGNV